MMRFGKSVIQSRTFKVIDPVEQARFDRYHKKRFTPKTEILDFDELKENNLGFGKFSYGISIRKGDLIVYSGFPERVYSENKFPDSLLANCIGKPILQVIEGHPDIDSRYCSADIIKRAFWDNEYRVTVFEIRRAV